MGNLENWHKYKTRTYSIHGKIYGKWINMKYRCTNPKNPGYKHYGGRGIKICDRRLGEDGFLNFKEDMYESYLRHVEEYGEKETTLDRTDNDGDYEPNNCRRATHAEQCRNKRNHGYVRHKKI